MKGTLNMQQPAPAPKPPARTHARPVWQECVLVRSLIARKPTLG